MFISRDACACSCVSNFFYFFSPRWNFFNWLHSIKISYNWLKEKPAAYSSFLLSVSGCDAYDLFFYFWLFISNWNGLRWYVKMELINSCFVCQLAAPPPLLRGHINVRASTSQVGRLAHKTNFHAHTNPIIFDIVIPPRSNATKRWTSVASMEFCTFHIRCTGCWSDTQSDAHACIHVSIHECAQFNNVYLEIAPDLFIFICYVSIDKSVYNQR